MASKKRMNESETPRVGDIMIPLEDYPHLPVWSSILDGVRMMHYADLTVDGRKSLPRIILLFDLDGTIVGTVRRRDLMRGLEPKFLVSQPLEYRKKLFDVAVDSNLAELSWDKMANGIREQANRPITDVMRPIRRTIAHHEHLMKAVYEIVINSLSILPVMRENKVVGVVRTVDVFGQLAKLVLDEQNTDAE